MKLKQIVVNKKLERELQNNDIYVEELCFEENKLDVLVLTKKDIEKIEESVFEYRNHKGNVFERAIDVFQSCKMEDFLKAYIMCNCDDMYEFLEFDYDFVEYKFCAVTCSRNECLVDLQKLLKHFSSYDSYDKCGTVFCEVEKVFFKKEYCW